MMKNYVMYSYSSYCAADALTAWDCYWCDQVTPLKYVTSFDDDNTNTFGYMGYVNGTIIISFRGTIPSSLANWITDLQFAQTAPYPNIDGAEVHSGFYAAYSAVQSQVLSQLNALHSKFPKAPIFLTGHSLGAALSILCAVDLTFNGFNASQLFALNFGDPRVGNDVFAQYHNQQTSMSYRVVNQHDIVPHLPFKWMGFWHIATEVWFENNVTDFVVCDNSGEDPNCSSSQVDLSVFDHLTYLGFDQRDGHQHGCS